VDLLADKGISSGLITHIQRTVHYVNKQILDDASLGSGFQIGHSYFCGYDKSLDEDRWYHRVLHFEIKPLLEEIWFDNLDKVENLVDHMSR